jgi:hypothetical protein
MKDRQVTCSELEEDLANIAMIFKQANSRKNRKIRV